MDWAWALGMLVLSGVPAIVGGGLVWSIFDKWTPVVIWEVVLLLGISLLIAKSGKKEENAHH